MGASAPFSFGFGGRHTICAMGLVKCPLSYSGSKYRLLPRLLPLFPRDCPAFVDLFGGGGTVCMNHKGSGRTVYSEKDAMVCGVVRTLRDSDGEALAEWLKAKADEVGLMRGTPRERAKEANAHGYARLVGEYNASRDPRLLLLIGMYSLNGGIRFNSRGEFNYPLGHDEMNASKLANVKRAHEALQGVEIVQGDAFSFPFGTLPKGSFVYMDPPYRLAEAVYNGGWAEADSDKVMEMADSLNGMGMTFGLSEAFRLNGRDNPALREWALGRGYDVHEFDVRYSNMRHGEHSLPDAECYITNAKAGLW